MILGLFPSPPHGLKIFISRPLLQKPQSATFPREISAFGTQNVYSAASGEGGFPKNRPVDISQLKRKLIPMNFLVEIEMTYLWKLILGNFQLNDMFLTLTVLIPQNRQQRHHM